MQRQAVSVTLLIVLGLLLIPSCVGALGLPAGHTFPLTANAMFYDGSKAADPVSIYLQVVQVAGVQVQMGAPPAQTYPGQACYVPFKVTNTGNGIDKFSLTAQSSSGWATAVVIDPNLDGVHQVGEDTIVGSTGSLAADMVFAGFIKATPPTSGGAGDTVTLSVVSAFDPIRCSSVVKCSLPGTTTSTTSLTASASPSAPEVGETVTISGQLSPAMQQKISVKVVDPVGVATSSSVTTAADGSFTTTFTPAMSGGYRVELFFAGSGSYQSCSKELAVTVDRIDTSISISASSQTVGVGETVTFSGALTPGIVAKLLVVWIDGDGTRYENYIQTSADGSYSWSVIPKSVSDGQISVTFDGTSTHKFAQAYTRVVIESRDEDVITFTQAPAVDKNPAMPGERVQLSATATDSGGHSLNYNWSDNGAGGTFIPSAAEQNPIYRPGENATGSDIQINITCTASCSVNSSISENASVMLTVKYAVVPHIVFVSPLDRSIGVSLDEPIVVGFDVEMDKAAVERAISTEPFWSSPVYTWSEDGKSVSITHGGFKSSSYYKVGIADIAASVSGGRLERSHTWAFTTKTLAYFTASDVNASPGKAFATPAIVVNDPQNPQNVTFSISLPSGVSIDTTTDDYGSLACVKKGAGAGELHAEWVPDTRQIVIQATVPMPAPNVEVVKSITMFAAQGSDGSQVLLNDDSVLTIRLESGIPGDINGDGAINQYDADAFYAEWARTHKLSNTGVNPAFDLAPRSVGAWPNWSPVGDGMLNIHDATAFIECWTQSKNTTGSYADSTYVYVSRWGRIYVWATNTPDGVFKAEIPVPYWGTFDATVDSWGNLVNVIKQSGVGSLFFTEYDPKTRTIHITGSTAPSLTSYVAIIYYK